MVLPFGTSIPKQHRSNRFVHTLHMSDMTSGIASYTEDKQWQKEWLSDPTRVWKPEELARIGIKESPLFEPGTG